MRFAASSSSVFTVGFRLSSASVTIDRNGSISRAELDGYIEAMVAGADADSDGGVSFSEARIFKIAKWRKALQLTSAN